MNYRSKNTKIVATVSDLNCEPEFIQQLYDHGADVIRLNTAHQSLEDSLRVIENIRKVSNKLAILVDTKGPEIRTEGLAEAVELKKGDHVIIGRTGLTTDEIYIPLSYDKIADDVPEGANILINDGEVKFTVIEKREDCLYCHVDNDGKVKNRKSVNVPNVSIKLPSLTQKDIDYIKFSIDNNVDFIAHSFVRNKEDCLAVQKYIDEGMSDIGIIAKIENREGVDNINEILDNCYGVMVARGDLGIEVAASEVPYMQKIMIKACVKKNKPVIVATQMLESMIDNPRPTRAEVSDVANAILDGTSAVMLSGETAYGKYPIEAVKVMSEMAIELADKKKDYLSWMMNRDVDGHQRAAIVKALVQMAVALDVKSIVVPSLTGHTARILASFHIRQPIHSFCYNETVMRQLALCYGIRNDHMELVKSTDELVSVSAAKYLENNNGATKKDLIIVAGTNPKRQDQPVNFIEIDSVEHCMELRK